MQNFVLQEPRNKEPFTVEDPLTLAAASWDHMSYTLNS